MNEPNAWRRLKKQVKKVLEKHGIDRYECNLLTSGMTNKDMLADIWVLGISHITVDTSETTPTSQTLGRFFVERCDNGDEYCIACINPDASAIGKLYSNEDRVLSDEVRNNSKYLWAYISNDDSWKPDNITVDIVPSVRAHRPRL